MSSSPSPLAGHRVPGLRRQVATAGVLLGLIVAAFEGTVVTSAMPTIVRALGGVNDYAWVFSAFLIASTAAVLVCGRLADAFGRRPVFVAGMATFLIGSALCGASATFGQLVAFRVIQGLGAGAIQPIAMTISADIFTLEERARIQALFNGAWGAANVVGPVMGGWIVMHGSWRWVFLVNVPVGVLAAALLVGAYRDPPREHRQALRARAMFWPILPAPALRNPAVLSGLAAGAFVGAILYSCAAYVPLWMSGHGKGDALAAGLALMPMLLGWALGSSFGVKVLVRRGMRASVGGAFAVGAAGAAVLAIAVANELPVAVAFAALALLGVGVGPAASSSLVAAQSSVPWRTRGAVTSAVYATRMLGGSLAVAALGALGGASDPAAARFTAIALMALGAMATLLAMAPHKIQEADLVPTQAPAE